jgi:hypothetical protein
MIVNISPTLYLKVTYTNDSVFIRKVKRTNQKEISVSEQDIKHLVARLQYDHPDIANLVANACAYQPYKKVPKIYAFPAK